MASHLTIISGNASGVSSRSFGSGQTAGAESGDVLGVFGALLDKAAQNVPAADGHGKEASKTDIASVFRAGLEATTGDAADTDGESADAIAAIMDGAAPAAIPVDPAPLVGFIDALTSLKASLDKGEPLDPDLLGKVEAALSKLADALGLDLDTLPVPQDIAALLDSENGGLAGTLAQLLAPLEQSLAGAQPAEDATAIAGEAGARDQLKALGDKLAALLAALEEGDVPAEKLAAIGVPAEGEPAEGIQKALARFAATLPTDTPEVPKEPVLATPSLKTPDPVLSSEAENAPASAAKVSETPAADSKGKESDNRPSERSAEPARREPARNDTRPAPNPAQAAEPNAPAATTASAGTAQDGGSVRVDAEAGPRVIQSGYQTSQQQLNLPQIAFELGRQIEGGNTRFQIRLDPPELGRIDVRLDIDRSGQVNARLTVEKSETLDLMQRDQRALERALQQAGLDSGKTNLEFSLKQNPFAGQSGQQDRSGGSEAGFGSGETSTETVDAPPPTVNLYRGSLQASGVNIIA